MNFSVACADLKLCVDPCLGYIAGEGIDPIHNHIAKRREGYDCQCGNQCRCHGILRKLEPFFTTEEFVHAVLTSSSNALSALKFKGTEHTNKLSTGVSLATTVPPNT